MFSIKKTGEGYYLASLRTSLEVLGREECNHLKHELLQELKPHREISIDMKGVKNIQREGFRIIKEMVRQADQKRCRIRFININPMITASISKLSQKKVEYHDEFEEL
jgi:anti-anti-sigma regulatory factor